MTTAGCNPLVRSITDPMPGVWEITVESARTSPSEFSLYKLVASVFGVTTDKPAALGTVELRKPVGKSNSRAAIWTAGGGLRHLPDLGYHSEAKLINADGWIIGTADAGPWEPHAVAWDPQGNLFDLNALLAESDKFWIDGIVGMVEGGFVVYGQALDGQEGNTAIVRF